jgi:hypothetical protein
MSVGGKKLSWIEFVKKIQKEENISFKEALSAASKRKKEWQHGGAHTGVATGAQPVKPVVAPAPMSAPSSSPAPAPAPSSAPAPSVALKGGKRKNRTVKRKKSRGGKRKSRATRRH